MSRSGVPVLRGASFPTASFVLQMSEDSRSVLDQSVVDELKRFPTPRLVRLLFPGHPVRDNGVMRSPFREDHNPSFSCFRGRMGVSMWKDHATDESGDNISLYRKVYPQYGYVEAVDHLALLVLGRHAASTYTYGRAEVPARRAVPSSLYTHSVEHESESKLVVVRAGDLDARTVPAELRDYWRGRGISDAVARSLCRYVVFENTNRKGRALYDPSSGVPLLDRDGSTLKDDGLGRAIGLGNDAGGYVLRMPATDSHRAFKGTTMPSFITTVTVNGQRPGRRVVLGGEGTNFVNFVKYDMGAGFLWINNSQYFSNVDAGAAAFACAFVSGYENVTLGERDVRCIGAALDALSLPAAEEVVVVEGMFDGLSERELNKGRRGRDLVILNSVGNLRWAVPFICRHRRAVVMLDNDRSGRKATSDLAGEVAGFCRATGVSVAVVDGSSLYEGYKDLNDALMASKGYPVERLDARQKDAADGRKPGGRSM